MEQLSSEFAMSLRFFLNPQLFYYMDSRAFSLMYLNRTN